MSPLVAYLSTAGCPFTGETFFVQGGVVKRVRSWEMAETVERKETWTVDALGDALGAGRPELARSSGIRKNAPSSVFRRSLRSSAAIP